MVENKIICEYGVKKEGGCSPTVNIGGNAWTIDYKRCIPCLLSEILGCLKEKVSEGRL